MSILFQPIKRGMQIKPTSRLARSTASQYHHAHLRTLGCIVPNARGVDNGKASKRADPVRTARMRCELLQVGLSIARTSSDTLARQRRLLLTRRITTG